MPLSTPAREELGMARMSHTAKRYFAENPGFKVCRAGRHDWPRRGKLDRTGATTVETKECSDCGAVETRERSRSTGRTVSRKVKLPEGYGLQGERITREDLDLLYAEEIDARLAQRRSVVAQFKQAS